MSDYNLRDENYEWSEPSVTYMDELHPLVAEEKAQAVAVVGVAGALAKVLTAAVCCSCTSATAHAKYSQKEVMKDRVVRRALDV